MKKSIACALMLSSAAAFAGTSAKAPIPPPQEPELWRWFVGASAGYMEDLETGLYTGHIGVDTPYKLAGGDMSLYLEGGWAGKDEDFRVQTGTIAVFFVPATAELDVVPMTLNVKFEHAFNNAWHAYWGGGLGVSFVDIEVTSVATGVSGSDDDTVFTAQVFAGVGYDINPNWEVYGGARWMYFDEPEFNDAAASVELDLNDNLVFELGLRYTF